MGYQFAHTLQRLGQAGFVFFLVLCITNISSANQQSPGCDKTCSIESVPCCDKDLMDHHHAKPYHHEADPPVPSTSCCDLEPCDLKGYDRGNKLITNTIQLPVPVIQSSLIYSLETASSLSYKLSPPPLLSIRKVPANIIHCVYLI